MKSFLHKIQLVFDAKKGLEIRILQSLVVYLITLVGYIKNKIKNTFFNWRLKFHFSLDAQPDSQILNRL